jgi:hypothetical protein
MRIHLHTRSKEATATRAQLLALTAIIVAGMLLTLVLLVNTAAYTVAETTDETTPGDDAVRYRAAAVDGTNQILRAVNRAEHETPQSARGDVVDGVDALDTDLARSAADQGSVGYLETSRSRTTPGWIISADGTDGSLVNAHGATAYTVAGNVDRSRRVALVFDPGRLQSTTQQNVSERAFHVVFETPVGTTAVYVYRTAADVVVAAGSDGAVPRIICTVSETTDTPLLRLELSGERLEATRCPGVWPSSVLATTHPYRIGVQNADAVDGRLTATVQTATTPASPPPAGHDGVVPGVYDTTISVGHATETHRFETTVRVAPGEPRA